MAVFKYDSATDRVEQWGNGPANSGTPSNDFTRVSMSPNDPSKITIGAITTSREAAIAAGLLSPDAPPAPSQLDKDTQALAKAQDAKEAAEKAKADAEADIFRKSDYIIDQA